MIVPFFGFSTIIVGLGILITAGILIIIALFNFAKKFNSGEAGVRTGIGGIKVRTDWMICVPIFQRVEVMDLTVKNWRSCGKVGTA